MFNIHAFLLSLLLLAGFPVFASDWYECSFTDPVTPIARYSSPTYSANANGYFRLWGGWTNYTLRLKSDNQNIDAATITNVLNTIKSHTAVLGVFYIVGSRGSVGIYQGANQKFTGPGIPAHSVSGYMTVEMGCAGEAHCAAPKFTIAQGFSMSIDKRLSFNDSSNINAPSLKKSLLLPVGPKNEYEPHELTITGTLDNTVVGYSTMNGVNIPGGDKTHYFTSGSASSEIKCVRQATPLTLKFSESIINFDKVMAGSKTPLMKELTWQASGYGIANRWTMRFESDKSTPTGDSFTLGGASVYIRDENDTPIKLGNDVGINSGTSGAVRFYLDPRNAGEGTYSTDIRVTLTAD
ncbi:hypothetical protein GW742_24820 [Citrobacter freundii]|nr:hypothetical protein [Citrobacter freundii]MBC6509562.1 hypothetical protein [Citrobacter freundii]